MLTPPTSSCFLPSIGLLVVEQQLQHAAQSPKQRLHVFYPSMTQCQNGATIYSPCQLLRPAPSSCSCSCKSSHAISLAVTEWLTTCSIKHYSIVGIHLNSHDCIGHAPLKESVEIQRESQSMHSSHAKEALKVHGWFDHSMLPPYLLGQTDTEPQSHATSQKHSPIKSKFPQQLQ
jgi:hypothetical protein